MYRIQVYKIQAGRIYAVDYVSGRRLEIMATRGGSRDGRLLYQVSCFDGRSAVSDSGMRQALESAFSGSVNVDSAGTGVILAQPWECIGYNRNAAVVVKLCRFGAMAEVTYLGQKPERFAFLPDWQLSFLHKIEFGGTMQSYFIENGAIVFLLSQSHKTERATFQNGCVTIYNSLGDNTTFPLLTFKGALHDAGLF